MFKSFNLLSLIFVISFFNLSCTDDTSQEIIEETGVKPEIKLSKNLDFIEKITDFNITISSNNPTQTSLFIDDIKLITSYEKTFDFSIDPFDFAVGNHKLKIISTDSQDAESIYEQKIDVKRLLFRDETFSSKENPLGGTRYISIHSNSGTLIDIKKIEGANDGVFYAGDGFQKQELIVTRYEFPTLFDGFYGIYSYLNVVPGTTISANQNTTNPYFFPKTESLNFNSEIMPELTANNYNSVITGNDNSSYNLLYSLNQKKNFLITTSPESLNNLDDFKYIIIDDLNKTEYNNSDFKVPNSIEEIQIPDSNSYRLNLYGFIDEDDFMNKKFHEVFVSRNLNTNNIKIPLIEEFEIYQARLAYSTNNAEVYVHQDITDKKIDSPNIDIVQNGNTIFLVGDYDYLSLNLTLVTPDNTNSVSWGIISSKKDSLNIVQKYLEIPEIISQTLLAKGIDLNFNENSNQSKFLSCSLYKNFEYNYNKDELITVPNLSLNRNGFNYVKTLSIN